MRYRDLKDERDAAIARAVEAERLSMKSEVDRIVAEYAAEKARLIDSGMRAVKTAYRAGFLQGAAAKAAQIEGALYDTPEAPDPEFALATDLHEFVGAHGDAVGAS